MISKGLATQASNKSVLASLNRGLEQNAGLNILTERVLFQERGAWKMLESKETWD